MLRSPESLGDSEVSFIGPTFPVGAGRTYDTVFFAFWLTHVPSGRFEEFWEKIRQVVTPGGRVVFIDDGPRKMELEDPLPAIPEAVCRRAVGRECPSGREGAYHPQIGVSTYRTGMAHRS